MERDVEVGSDGDRNQRPHPAVDREGPCLPRRKQALRR